MTVFDTPRQRVRAGAVVSRLRIPGLRGLAAAGLVTAAALLPVVQSSNATTAGYEIRQLERRKSDLQASIYNAQSEIAELGSLQRIDREARDRLGMVPATRTVMVTVDEAPPAPWRVPARFAEPQEEERPAARPAPTGWRALLARLSPR